MARSPPGGATSTPIPSSFTTCIAPRRPWPRSCKSFGCDEVVTGIGRTGVVGVIRGSKPGDGGRVIGLRADMDALPIEEATERPIQVDRARQDACLRP